MGIPAHGQRRASPRGRGESPTLAGSCHPDRQLGPRRLALPDWQRGGARSSPDASSQVMLGQGLEDRGSTENGATGRGHGVCPLRATRFCHMAIDRRILIADDDREVRLGATELLGRLGLSVLQAGSGDEALEVVRCGDPLHLALLDVHMPGRGGLEIFDLLHRERPELPCILWSGEASQGVADWALRSGASAFLRKPVQPRLLRDEVQRILEVHWGRAG